MHIAQAEYALTRPRARSVMDASSRVSDVIENPGGPGGLACNLHPRVTQSHTISLKIRLITKNVSAGRRIAKENLPRRTGGMPIVKITGQGLAAMAISVALLWACVVGQRIVVRRAVADRVQVLREIQQMQQRQRSEPVLAPAPRIPHRERITTS